MLPHAWQRHIHHMSTARWTGQLYKTHLTAKWPWPHIWLAYLTACMNHGQVMHSSHPCDTDKHQSERAHLTFWHFAEVMQYVGSTAYASRLSSSSSSRISSFRSYLLKMAAISAASLSERPYFSGLKPYVSFALLSVNSAERFLRVDASAFSFYSTSLLFQAWRSWETNIGRWSAALRWVKRVILIQSIVLTCCVPTAVCADMNKLNWYNVLHKPMCAANIVMQAQQKPNVDL